MVDTVSPLEPVLNRGRFANTAAQTGVVISEPAPGSIVQLAAWPDTDQKVREAIASVLKLNLDNSPGAGAVSGHRAAFNIAPRRYLLAEEDEGLAERLLSIVPADVGSVTDLSHGRTAIRIDGEKSEWILAKFFAVDFSLARFPVGQGVSTSHHDIFTQIQRRSETTFDLYVFRSFARSFWRSLCHASEETGYEIR
ncbi:MAG: sarcosine oxidase subunit gamma [Rhizobiaceae bacterium]|nr:sarcosine oxidase subunit gamma [Rhizobiaceae bacterium]